MLDLSLLWGAGVPPAERIRLDLFVDVSYTAILDREEDTYSGRAWIGVIDGAPLSTVVFVRVGERARPENRLLRSTLRWRAPDPPAAAR